MGDEAVKMWHVADLVAAPAASCTPCLHARGVVHRSLSLHA
jgi:hypothetical protein